MKPDKVTIIGAPLALGCGLAGVELGPAAMRAAGLSRRIAGLGYKVTDSGNLSIAEPPLAASDNAESKETKLQNLPEIAEVCDSLAERVEDALKFGSTPIVLGGDHSIAAGSLSGVAKYFRDAETSWGLLWFDAHADMNTHETSPSGNIHGMPLAALLGYGTQRLTHLSGFAPKLLVGNVVHIGARDLDPGEKALIKSLGMRFITMREIDERGMNACIDEALEILLKNHKHIAVTFDIDALDPGDAPGSGTLVRGGLTYREAHLAMEKVAETEALCFLEMVEINTALDYNNRTAELGVELILSALGKSIL
jgi:arginase